jgi:cysteine-rich repeat protein
MMPPTPRCGDGILQDPEQCDTGSLNANVADRCRLDCANPRCGDGLKDSAEQCDDGNTANNDACSQTCSIETLQDKDGLNSCGDGLVQTARGEQFDNGTANGNAPSACRFSCLLPSCGDGIRDLNESCDDGNRRDHDGCSSFCSSEERSSASHVSSFPIAASSTGEKDFHTDPVTGLSYYCEEGTGLCYAFDAATGKWYPYDVLNHRWLNGIDPVTGIRYSCDQSGHCIGFDPLSGAWYAYDPVRHLFLAGPRSGTRHAASTQTGPGLAILIATGAAAGIGYVRRRR